MHILEALVFRWRLIYCTCSHETNNFSSLDERHFLKRFKEPLIFSSDHIVIRMKTGWEREPWGMSLLRTVQKFDLPWLAFSDARLSSRIVLFVIPLAHRHSVYTWFLAQSYKFAIQQNTFHCPEHAKINGRYWRHRYQLTVGEGWSPKPTTRQCVYFTKNMEWTLYLSSKIIIQILLLHFMWYFYFLTID